MTNGEKHIEKLLSWYKEAVTEDGVCYLTSDDKNTLAYALKCCKHYEDIKKDIDSWMLREEPSSSEIPNKSEISTGSDDCISRADALALFCDKCGVYNCISKCSSYRAVKKMPSVTPQEPRCKECKWWKDSDGAFRRGIGAESQCPINTQAVYRGEGYCYKFSPKADNREVEE